LMRRVIILTASFGQGHNTAAFNLRDAFRRVAPEVQVQVLDLLKLCYGARHEWARRTHLAMVRHAPRLWAWLYRASDRGPATGNPLRWLGKLRRTLGDLLSSVEPDAVIATHPAYQWVIDDLYADYRERPFLSVTVVTDSLSVHSAWHAPASDCYFVPNQLTAEVLTRAGVPSEKVLAYGFPVSPRFQELAEWQFMPDPCNDEWTRVLYVIHHGKANAGRVIERLLEIPGVQLTIACGANRRLRERIARRTRHARDRAHVFGWTERMPELLASSHLVIAKAGGAMVQEAIAARCPIIVNQAIPGQEEGNARLVEMLGVGTIAERDDDVVAAVRGAVGNDAKVWRNWKAALDRHSRPDAALRIAGSILEQCDAWPRTPDDFTMLATTARPRGPAVPAILEPDRPLLCDFHAHTTFSDGELSPEALVDFYGERGFDCLCITDHAAEKRHAIGRLTGFTGLVMTPEKMAAYFDVIEREKRRAWAKYNMVLMTGLELNKDRLTVDGSAHLLALDLQAPVNPNLDLKSLIRAIHQQGGLAVAAHPHTMHRLGERNTRYLWNHRREFAPLLDAWEVASRLDFFNPIARQQLPFLANSDFHKPRHIISWKTLLHCEKHPDAVKQSIRENRAVAITFYREKSGQPAPRCWPVAPALQPAFLGAYSPAQLLLPLAA
ncbi:MAG: PHP domain-containing protein, partial [Verrucomicrobiae bacterium]|nr:PHP domain-containing protein [Verrucomicrobiae bacterium]